MKNEDKINNKNQVEVLLKEAKSLSQKMNFSESINSLEKVLTIAHNQNNNLLEASSFFRLGKTYICLNDYKLALENFNIAYQIYAKHKKLPETSLTLNEIGKIFAKLQQIDLAISYFLQALQLDNSSINAASFLSNLGNSYAIKKDYNLAKNFYKKSEKIFRRENSWKNLSICLNNLGRIALKNNDYDNSMIYLKEALNICDENDFMECKALITLNIGNLHHAQGKLSEAIEKYKNAEDFALSTFNKDMLKNIYEQTASCYSDLREFDKAYYYQKKFSDFVKDIFSDKLSQKILEIKSSNHNKKIKDESELYRIRNIQLKKLNRQLTDTYNELEKAYEKLDSQKSELISKNLYIEKQNQDLLSLNQEKDTIMNIVAHDLRNPLSVILRATEMIELQISKCHELNCKQKISYIISTITQMETLIDEMLDSSKFNETEKLKLEKHDLSEIVGNVLESFNSIAKEKNITLSIKHPNEPIFSKIQENRFKQVIQNIISNALKFTPHNKKISIEVFNYDKFNTIVISDQGIGIPNDLIPKLFNRFTKAGRKGIDGEKSTGLGLSIVKRLVELHNGIITVKSEVNKGSSFTIKLPSI